MLTPGSRTQPRSPRAGPQARRPARDAEGQPGRPRPRVRSVQRAQGPGAPQQALREEEGVVNLLGTSSFTIIICPHSGGSQGLFMLDGVGSNDTTVAIRHVWLTPFLLLLYLDGLAVRVVCFVAYRHALCREYPQVSRGGDRHTIALPEFPPRFERAGDTYSIDEAKGSGG